jgi:hypothetical protein
MDDLAFDDYAALACRTLAPTTPAVLDRANQAFVRQVTASWLYHQTEASKQADGLKRAIFYGKPDRMPNETSYRLDEDMTSLVMTPEQATVLHMLLGVSSELGELMAAVMGGTAASLADDHGMTVPASAIKPLEDIDIVNVGEEAADACWYLANLLLVFKKPLPPILINNIRKLYVRYPDKFSELNAATRDLLAERKELEA